jgi:hypothetical protein
MEFEDYHEFVAIANIVVDELVKIAYYYDIGKIDRKEVLKFLIKFEAVIKEFELEPPPFKNKEQRRCYKELLVSLKKAVKNIRKNVA